MNLRLPRAHARRARALAASLVLSATVVASLVAAPAEQASASAHPGTAAVSADRVAPAFASSSHHHGRSDLRAVSLATAFGEGRFVGSVLLSGPDPETGRPGWTHCVQLPFQPSIRGVVTVPLRAARYQAVSFGDGTCSPQKVYSKSCGPITAFESGTWLVRADLPPQRLLR